MATPLHQLRTKTPEQIRTDILRTFRAEMLNMGYSDPDVSPGTDHYLLANALANELGVIHHGVKVAAEQLMPDTATGENLFRQTRIYGLDLRDAGGSSGHLWLTGSAALMPIATGQQLQDPTSLRYRVSVGGIYSSGDLVPLASLDSGSNVNLAAGTVLKWVTAPAFVASTALVSSGGLTGGVDKQDQEDLRSQFIEYLRNPPGGGNWPQVAYAAEKASTQVQKAFVYPAANGPGTCHVAVVRAPTATNKNRDVNILEVNNVITPIVATALAEYAEIVLTTVTNSDVNVALGLSLPSAPTAVPAGPGGGWLDGVPFPQNLTSTGYSDVLSVSSTTSITVRSQVAPVAGVSHICWLSSIDWKLYRSVVASFTDIGSSTYRIELTTPLTGITDGEYIFPDAVNMDAYVAAVLNDFAKKGPGQKTDVAGVLPRAYRKPLASQSWPSDMGPSTLRFLSETGSEVLDVQYLYRNDTSPRIPNVVDAAPYIMVPRRIAFYKLP